jgi:hypothetical protein
MTLGRHRHEGETCMKSLRRHFDPWSLVVIILTFVLFIMALFVKGMTHDLLLEAGVFLVSVKLILMSHKASVLAQHTDGRLDDIYNFLRSRDPGR